MSKLSPLHDYQERAINFMSGELSHPGKSQIIDGSPRSYLALGLGLGKTRITLEVIKNTPGTFIVFAPLTVVMNTWPDEIAKWAPEISYTILHGANKDLLIKNRSKLFITNYDSILWLHAQLARNKKARSVSLIFDELTKLKDPGTKRFKAIKKMLVLLQASGRLRTGLAARITPNGLQNVFAQMQVLDDGRSLGTSYTKFKQEYFTEIPRAFKLIPRESAASEIAKRISPHVFQLKTEDHLKMPEKISTVDQVILPPDIMQKYKEFEKEFVLQTLEGDVEAWNAAALSCKLRQFMQGSVYGPTGEPIHIHDTKLRKLQAWVESLNDEAAIVPIQFRFEIPILAKAFPKADFVVGGMRPDLVRDIVQRWNKGKVKILFAHPATLSHGLNLQYGGRNIFWYGLPWSFEQYEQLTGRIYRQGQERSVLVKHLVCTGTVDEVVLQNLTNKKESQETMFEALKRWAEEKAVSYFV